MRVVRRLGPGAAGSGSSAHRRGATPTFWTTRSRPSGVAERLIAHRSAELIQIEDADTFFEKLKEDITAIEEFSKPHPVSVDVAVTKLKRYMPECQRRSESARKRPVVEVLVTSWHLLRHLFDSLSSSPPDGLGQALHPPCARHFQTDRLPTISRRR